MARPKKSIIEYRDYHLPSHFPVLLLTGEHWRISDIPSGRLHIHNCLEIGFCESDSGTMEFEDTAYPFHAGDVTVVSCDIPHTTYSTTGFTSKWSYLFVNLADLLYPLFLGTDIQNIDLLSFSEHHLSLIMSREEYPIIYSLIIRIIDEMKQKEDGYELSVRGLFLALATNLMRITSAIKNRGNDQPKNALVIAPALNYVRYHYMDDFQMEYLAALCGLSPTHFRRLFSSVMHTSPLEHLNSIRIRKAADLLRMTEDSVVNISERVGFHSVSSFNRHFSEIMNTTPREWRHQMSILKDQSILKYNGWMYAELLKRKN
ncbi:helix-turn-helix transcriptional regulator [Lacrimispora indolis]|uniref:helix-turn-helix transcriptional regulator n=1 Tax=Lacrimispora indolis TaxID=69825 RepID=UPI0004067E2B|nr:MULTISPECIES: helix-turn-helix transcriptional regulator [Lachnospiraceae]MBE7722463.1 AraC family transcriptional regulator [Lacrimispora celerecrescens]